MLTFRTTTLPSGARCGLYRRNDAGIYYQYGREADGGWSVRFGFALGTPAHLDWYRVFGWGWAPDMPIRPWVQLVARDTSVRTLAWMGFFVEMLG